MEKVKYENIKWQSENPEIAPLSQPKESIVCLALFEEIGTNHQVDLIKEIVWLKIPSQLSKLSPNSLIILNFL